MASRDERLMDFKREIKVYNYFSSQLYMQFKHQIMHKNSQYRYTKFHTFFVLQCITSGLRASK